MKQQLYDKMVSKYSVGISNAADFVPSSHVKGIVETLDGKADLSEASLEDIDLDSNEDGSYDIHIDAEINNSLGISTTINYSPDNERCVTHSNQIIGGTPPEGPTYDGNGDQLGGIR